MTNIIVSADAAAKPLRIKSMETPDIKNQQKEREQRRKKNNEDLVAKMKAGLPLFSYSNQSSWFPPRPKIQKDEKAIQTLYGSKSDSNNSQDCEDNQVKPTLKIVK